MKDDDLVRRLRRLSRTVGMLQSDLRDGRMNDELLADMEAQMENGIASATRCAGLVALVDALRESTLTPRAELHADTARACERMKDAIEDLAARLG